MVRNTIIFISILATVGFVGLLFFTYWNGTIVDEPNASAHTTSAPSQNSESLAEENPFRDGFIRGDAFVAFLGPCNDDYPDLGDLSCNANYLVRYDTIDSSWTVIGPLSSTTPHASTRGPVRAEDGQMSFWGARFVYDEDGIIYTRQLVRVGHLAAENAEVIEQ
jgi:hypothetical protein